MDSQNPFNKTIEAIIIALTIIAILYFGDQIIHFVKQTFGQA